MYSSMPSESKINKAKIFFIMQLCAHIFPLSLFYEAWEIDLLHQCHLRYFIKIILKAKILCYTKSICQCLESDAAQLTTTLNVAFYQSPFIKAAEPWMNSFFRPTVVTRTHEVPGKQRCDRRERLWNQKGKQQGVGDHSYFHSCLGINHTRK